MNEILLCTHNPILKKSFYGILRDEGFEVEMVDHPSLAVQMVLEKSYIAIIIDSEPFGLSVEDAIHIIKTVLPQSLVILVGYDKLETDVVNINVPVDLEEFKRTIRDIHRLGALSQTA